MGAFDQVAQGMRTGGGVAGGGSQGIQAGGFSFGGGLFDSAARGHAPQGQWNYGYDYASQGVNNTEMQAMNQLLTMLGMNASPQQMGDLLSMFQQRR